MSKTILTVSSGLPRVPRGMLVETADGQVFVVRKATATTLTLVPFRWWHRIPWTTILAFMVGAGVGRWIYWYLTR